MKNLTDTEHKSEIYYYDIGDYLSREEKLKIIDEFGSMEKLPFKKIHPNEHGDWISMRNEKFGTWIPLGDKKNSNNNSFFVSLYSNGAKTQRDAWSYNSSYDKVENIAKESIDFYNNTIKEIREEKRKTPEFNTTKISWSDGVLSDLKKERLYNYDDAEIREAMYRPFFMQKILWYSPLVDRMGKLPQIFPTTSHKNLLICIPGLGDKKDFSTLITNTIPDLGMLASSQCFPLYWYEIIKPDQNSLFGNDDAQIIKHEGVTDFILDHARSKYGNKVQREDIFYYVYGLLHSKSYKETYEADLKKMLVRIPLVSDYQKFWAFSKAGRALANLHLNYEQIAAYPDVKIESLKKKTYAITNPKYIPFDHLLVAEREPRIESTDSNNEYEYYAVQQMKFPQKGQKDTIIYNHYHTIKNIPEKAYRYVVNGKSAVEWIMERYAIITDKKSGIKNDPNDWSKEHEKPRYIFDLLLSVINVSVQTVDIVNSLPEVDWDKE